MKSGGTGAENGIDWTVARALLRHYKSQHARKDVALQTLIQGTLRHKENGGVPTCSLCNQELSLQHLLWECQWFHGRSKGVPVEWQSDLRKCETPCFWLRGWVPKQWTYIEAPEGGPTSFVGTGAWKNLETTYFPPAVHFATDASGGPAAKDPRQRVVSFAVLAFTIEGDCVSPVASITGIVPGRQTVFRGEAYAIQVLMTFTEGPVDCTSDSQTAVNKWKSPPRNAKRNADIWSSVACRQDLDRLKLTWVNSHLNKHDFAKRFGPHQEWRRKANAKVDHLARMRAQQDFDWEHHARVQTIDENARDVLKFLVDRVQLLLEAEPGDHPAKPLKPVGEEVATRGIGETKVRFKKGGGAGPNKESKTNFFQNLVQESSKSHQGHKWCQKACSISCAKCGAWATLAMPWKDILSRLETGCVDEENRHKNLPITVHPTHDLVSLGRKKQCAKCFMKVFVDTTNHPKGLEKPCRKRPYRKQTALKAEDLWQKIAQGGIERFARKK